MGAMIGLGWGVIWMGFWAVMVIARRKERQRIYDIVEQQLREGKTPPPQLMENLSPWGARRPWSDLRAGLILVALGLGLFAGGVINFYTYQGPHPQLFYGPYGLFPIPLFLGLGFMVLNWLRKEEGDR